jgi:phenylacetate-CoA ligase
LNLNILKYIYSRTPLFIKWLYSCIPYRFRTNNEYKEWVKLLTQKEFGLERDPFSSYKYAESNFLFYRNYYDGKNIDSWDEIPFIEKSQLKNGLDEFEKSSSKKFYVSTGGVTGEPSKFYQSNNVWYKELAFVHGFFGLYGYDHSMLKLSLRGGDFSNLKRNTFWLFNPIRNEIQFSPFHLNENTVKVYVQQINKVKPLFFHSYPSGLIRLLNLMRSENLTLSFKPKCIFLISESFTQNELDLIKAHFQCRVTSFYGLSERIIFAPYDDEKMCYFPDSRYGHFELIDEDNQVINENNVRGEIVGTSYDNLAMPLIRYRTGDFTQYVDFKLKAFHSIEGKWGQHFLVGKDDEEITITALNLHSNELNDLVRIQFVQMDRGLVTMNAHFNYEKSKEELGRIENLLNNRVGNCIDFIFSENNEFYTNQRGKTPLIVR